MLGTNDTKDRFAASAGCIGEAMARLIQKAQSTICWSSKGPNILVIAPPPIGDGMLTSSVMPIMGLDCPAKSRELAKYYEAQCRLLGVSFLDAGALGCEFNQIDYMHLTRRGHARLADELGKRIPQML